MSNESAATKKTYHEPKLIDYGKMSELTRTITGNTGDDGGGGDTTFSSYTAS